MTPSTIGGLEGFVMISARGDFCKRLQRRHYSAVSKVVKRASPRSFLLWLQFPSVYRNRFPPSPRKALTNLGAAVPRRIALPDSPEGQFSIE
ncbi:MAG: hypothetical protein DMG39_12540 [Acidobacteria bacterium]|nr:MAG: hypothetical protein DMG39_12540 [Acidobacteriota bacterium]